MSRDWRPIISSDRTPIQQGLATDPIDYKHYQMDGLMLGVILEVYPSDAETNRTARQSDQRRGFYHEAKVFLVNTNASTNLIVDHVVICPSVPTGLDDYYEHLPRGSSSRVDGARFSTTGAGIDPYDLDGDWCVVGFLGSSLDQPFIVTWWPHPRNFYDAATSGNGNADRSGNPHALEQQDRYFRRVNGVEHTITGAGDVYLSTTYANSSLQFSPDRRATKGRFPRGLDSENGGSVLVEIKPTQTLELAWDPQIDGAGVRRGNEPELPQTNPPPTSRQNASTQPRDEMYVKITRDTFRVDTPTEFGVHSKSRVRIFCDDTTTINASNLLELESQEVTIKGTTSVTLDGAQIALGDGAIDYLVKGTSLNIAWQALSAALTPGPASPDANKTAILGMIAALSTALSATSKTK